MDEAVAGRVTVEQALVRKSLEDESFRQGLLADPKSVMERELGRKLPAGVEVRVLEEASDTLYLVLPPGGTTGRSSDELSEAELDAVAGGQDGEYGGHVLRNWS